MNRTESLLSSLLRTSVGLRLSEASTKEVEAADASDGVDKVEGGGAAGNLPTPNLIPPLSAVSHKGVEIRKVTICSLSYVLDHLKNKKVIERCVS